MRTALSFDCDGAQLAATLDFASGATGLLVVSGGNEIRSGAHRGMAILAARIAAAGYPVLRFDRRGIGDSEGENGGFEASGPDIAAALAAFRRACPEMKQVAAFGNCDAASALVLHQPLDVDALILANPWTIESAGDDDAPALPPAAAIRKRYWQRLKDPASLGRLLRGQINLSKLARGTVALMSRPTVAAADLGSRVVAAISAARVLVIILLATGDRTAQAFAEHWRGADRAGQIPVMELNSASHSFAGDDADWLTEQLLNVLGRKF